MIKEFYHIRENFSIGIDKYNELLSYAKKLEDKNSSRPHLDNLIKSVGKLNEKLNDLDSKNKALASELITTKDKYTSLLEKQVSLLENKNEVFTLSQNLAKKGTRLSKSEKDEIVRLYRSGLSLAEICRRVERSDSGVRNAIRGEL
ncbi:helix-turn-helix domain-containing protein [Campylobacter sp. FMV-PI01]|uniref:Helix-turn-helix domain-containing protein n=1 Tax=Campylobacter portucalensis TaxID=2608384 RepID=A0A6L5WI19_9BACT|nr:helix-turn-helix domain-containing protein [Campylobacter portucalensis]MSN96769.1 helix-turn-helix domain-containing protein [Campylobacter portucalensis]